MEPSQQHSTSMDQLFEQKIDVGISSCLLGQQVRYDGGHKQSRFCRHELSQYFNFLPTCPEMGIGLGTPRKTIRLVSDAERVQLVTSDGSADYTEQMEQFSEQRMDDLAHLSGYIVCAKSPSCGMERVSVYSPAKNNSAKDGRGVFTRILMERYPLLPVEEDGRLNDVILRENFITRVYAYKRWQQLREGGLTLAKVMGFHARYKYQLMAHQPLGYRKLGRMLGQMAKDDIAGLENYFAEFMAVLKHNCSRKNHTNVLMHIQGYFKRKLTSSQRVELSERILQYRKGTLPLLVPLTLLQHYLREHPSSYIENQVYLQPHPAELKLRYAM